MSAPGSATLALAAHSYAGSDGLKRSITQRGLTRRLLITKRHRVGAEQVRKCVKCTMRRLAVPPDVINPHLMLPAVEMTLDRREPQSRQHRPE